MKSKPYSLRTPCDNCPFRTDVAAYLRAARVRQIEVRTLRGEFHCHKTVRHDDDGEPLDTGSEAHCAGALILMEKIQRPSQMMRIAFRLGVYDPKKLNMDAPVFESWDDMAAAQDDHEAGDPCHVVNDGCYAPAGMLVDGEVVGSSAVADAECAGCGDPVCTNSACSKMVDGERLCACCLGEDEY